MRIVKLSKRAEFADLNAVREFFAELPSRTPPGKFRLPDGWIAKDHFNPNERLIFTFEGRAVFIGRSQSGVLPNEDEYRHDYPSYFVVDTDSLRELDVDLSDLEQKYNAAAQEKRGFRGQGWTLLAESPATDAVWRALGGV